MLWYHSYKINFIYYTIKLGLMGIVNLGYMFYQEFFKDFENRDRRLIGLYDVEGSYIFGLFIRIVVACFH
jgi:hypothetical protein